MKTVDFYERSRSFLYRIFFQVLYVLCFTRPRYQVSVYRTIGPLVLILGCKLLFIYQSHSICELVLSTKIDFYLFIMKLVCYLCDGGSEKQHFQNLSQT